MLTFTNTESRLTLTIQEIMHALQISRRTVERMVQDGRLPKPYKLGRAVRFPREETLRALEATREVS